MTAYTLTHYQRDLIKKGFDYIKIVHDDIGKLARDTQSSEDENVKAVSEHLFRAKFSLIDAIEELGSAYHAKKGHAEVAEFAERNSAKLIKRAAVLHPVGRATQVAYHVGKTVHRHSKNEERKNAPHFDKRTLAHFQSAMEGHLACFQKKGLTCNVKPGQVIDNLHGCEVAVIGSDYTWHTHPCGLTPSMQDVASTKQLGKRYLCIGHSPTKSTTCYDTHNGMRVACKVR